MQKQPDNADERHLDRVRRKMIAAIAAGHLSPSEVQQALAVTRMTVFRWLREAGINHKQARRKYAATIVDRILNDTGAPTVSTRRIKTIVAAKARKEFEEAGQAITRLEPVMPKYRQQGQEQVTQNPRKAEVLLKLRAGTMTIPQAAKYAGIAVSAICGWCRIYGIAIPDEFNQPRRRPRED